MSKQLIIAAFPQAAMKFCIYEDNKVTDEKQCWQPDANLTLALYLNKYSHLDMGRKYTLKRLRQTS